MKSDVKATPLPSFVAFTIRMKASVVAASTSNGSLFSTSAACYAHTPSLVVLITVRQSLV
jgi:hypothetical protein